MTNKKSTKKALLMSALSLLLCVSMLVGTTFAWFTDSVSTNKNHIVAGNLDVELYWSTTMDENDWHKVDGNTDVFTGNLWEPGHTEVVYLKVVNEGTLALKYNLSINIYNETPGINVDNEEFWLSDHIMYDVHTVVSKYATRNAAREAAEAGATKLNAAYANADILLEKGEDDIVAMVVYMPETVENEANYRGTAPEIYMGINLVATQYTYEEDSFDEFYDGAIVWYGGVDYSWYDPTATEYVIGSPEQLAGLANIVNGTAPNPLTRGGNANIQDSFAGKTIKLASDLNLNNLPWTPIGSWDYTFDGTFDGQGHTIYNLNINEPEGEGVGLFGVTYKATITGITLHNVKIHAYSMVAGVVGAPYPANISDCHVAGNVEIVADYAYVAGIAGYCYYGTQVDGCSVIAEDTGLIHSVTRNAVGGITAWLLEGNHKVTNCQVKNLNLVGWTNIGGITGFVHYNNTIEGCSVENVTLTKTRVDGNPGIGLIAGGWSYSASNAITLRNNTVKNATMEGTHIAYTAYNELYGSEYGGATTANFVLENNTTDNVTNNLVEVKKVTNVDELTAALTNGGNYYLGNDIALDADTTIKAASGTTTVLNLNGKTITAISDQTGSNRDVFDVRGNLTVTNGTITYTHTGANMGWNSSTNVFNVTAGGVLNISNATIENLGGSDMAFGVHLNNWGEVTLNVENSTIKSTYCAIRVFNSGFDMNNVTIKNSTIYSTGNRAIWVHNYIGDLDSSKHSDEAVNARLNFNIFGNGNKFVAETDAIGGPIRYGFAKTIYYSAEGVLVVKASTQDALNSAVKADDEVNVALGEGNYTLPGVSNGDVTISGTKDTVITVTTPNYGGSDVTFNGVTVKGSGYATGVQHVDTVTYNDVTIVGEMCLYGEKVVFNNCTFELNGQYIWTYGAKEVEFNNCTFNTTGKAILIYNEGAGASKVTVKGCTFNATAGAKAGAIANQNCAAIEIDNFQNSGTGAAHVLITEGNTYSENFSGEWRIKNYVSGNEITVNGVAYTQIAVNGKLMTIDANKNVTVIE